MRNGDRLCAGTMSRTNSALTVMGGSLVATAASLTALGILASLSKNQTEDADAIRKQNMLILPLPPTSSPVTFPSAAPSGSSACLYEGFKADGARVEWGKQWQQPDEILGAALRRAADQLGGSR